MHFFIAITPPTATAQEKQVRIVNGKPLFYDPTPVKAAKRLLIAHLATHRPTEPMAGAVERCTMTAAGLRNHSERREVAPTAAAFEKV